TDAQEQALARARARIEAVIVGDLPDVPLSLSAQPDCGDVAVNETVDDLLVLVRFERIDGRGGVVGRAGPCVIRDASSLPILGIMHFDSADLADLEAAGQLESVILHELLHVTGLGTLWAALGRIAGTGTTDPVFTGPAARSAFLELDGGATYGGIPVPVESTGGAGTAEGHWRESVFGRELMTGWISGTSQPLSRTSVASLADLGYAVELPQADAFDWTATLRLAPATEAPDVPVGDDALRIPLLRVDERGGVPGAREPR
ncbi:MAG TPA: leishmanolysin-related zinc metalloendopeptidase, partial [Anaeromyxobacteraceae bacterium]|nr:leishmanolysin-related zinc metalloendopeptidase [Anaeromyxobacteraceae bacterium]